MAAIVTPLGLYDHVAPEAGMTQVNFQYVKDISPLGRGTAPRLALGFSRFCYRGDYACANTDNIVTNWANGSISAEYGYDTRIPKETFDFMSSGRQQLGPAVSSSFDIQYRYWVKDNNSGYDFGNLEYYDNGSAYDIGGYRSLTSVLLSDDWQPVEGLIVDTKQGRVGFRKHSVPSTRLAYGGIWTEDLLFIQPITACVQLSITLDYKIGSASSEVSYPVIVDHGGFVNIDKKLPNYDNSNDQHNPHIADRVYQGAWYILVLLMLLWNVTNPGRNDSDFPLFSSTRIWGSNMSSPRQIPPIRRLGILTIPLL